MTTPALELRQITKRFGDMAAVDRVDLVVPRNSVVALVGESGSGKTTTGLLALRLLGSTSGQVLLEGEDITHLSQTKLKPYRRRMQVVFQDSYASLDPMMTLGEIVGEPLGIHGIGSRAERREQSQAWLEKVGLDGSYANRYPHELSGGQRQRVSLMRALMLDPELLLLDEPLGALDPMIRHELQRDLKELFASLNRTVVLVTHDIAEAGVLGDALVLLRAGRVEQQGSLAELLDRPRSAFVREFVASQRGARELLEEQNAAHMRMER